MIYNLVKIVIFIIFPFNVSAVWVADSCYCRKLLLPGTTREGEGLKRLVRGAGGSDKQLFSLFVFIF